MEKLMEKVGLYDLWTVFFPGAVGVISILSCYNLYNTMKKPAVIFFHSHIYVPRNISEWIVFSFFAIFFGILMQELGRFLFRIINFQDASEGLLDESRNVFTAQEICSLAVLFSRYGYDTKDTSAKESRRIFHCINSVAQNGKEAAKYVKLNILQNMARSFAAVFLILCVELSIEFGLFIYNKISGLYIIIILLVVSFFMIFVFVNRAKRFNRYWVRNLVYAVFTKYNASIGASE